MGPETRARAEHAARALNDLHALDPVAVDALFNIRIECRDSALADAGYARTETPEDRVFMSIGVQEVLIALVGRCDNGSPALLRNVVRDPETGKWWTTGFSVRE